MLTAKRLICLILVICLAAMCAGCSSGMSDASGAGNADTPREAPGGDIPSGEPPEMPGGGMPQGEPPEMPGGEMPNGKPPEKPGSKNEGFMGGTEFTQGTSANTIDSDGEISGAHYASDGDEENALRIDGANVTLRSVSVNKPSGESRNTEAGDFYGVNAALLVTNGALAEISGASISSSVKNGNGVFSYGEGTRVSISGSTISTTGDNSGGIQTTGGGTTEAKSLTVTTEGNSSAAIRSDRGGGSVTVTEGSYRTSGLNSPAIYSTADISVKTATLSAKNSEALVIEGKNSITLVNCAVYGCMSKDAGSSSDENVHNVMLYQSMSGDADIGTARLDITGGTLTGDSGDMFYVTNTHAEINLSNVTIKNNDKSGYLLRVSGNSGTRGWGKAGENGAKVDFTADAQELDGDILVDSISTLDITLKNESSFIGSISILKNGEEHAADGNVTVHIGEGCTWTLTGDCSISTLDNAGLINFNGYSITLSDGSVLK